MYPIGDESFEVGYNLFQVPGKALIFNRAGFIFTRVYGSLLGLALVLYGAQGVWVANSGPNTPSRVAFCGAWLCPFEFSPGRIYDLQLESHRGRADDAIRELQRAVTFDPASAYAWADLGEVFLTAHQPNKARYCLERAIVAGPNSPTILVRAANTYFTLGDYRGTMRYFSRVLQNPELTDYYPAVFLTYTRMDLPITELLTYGIPPTRWAAQGFLRFLMEGNLVADTESTWDWILGHALVNEKLSGEYVGFLLQNKQGQRAADTWARLHSNDMPRYRRTNWIFNGSFEQALQPSPLDWQIQPSDDVQASRFRGVAYEGSWSLQLIFRGENNIDYHQVFQEFVLHSGTWHAEGLVRTEGITTDQGVALRIYDAVKPQRLEVKTDALSGTHDWTKLERTFAVGPETSVVRVEVERQASQKLDNKIAGRAWVDAVKIDPAR
jgi:tetratricopeptide (TPR) repeat protein